MAAQFAPKNHAGKLIWFLLLLRSAYDCASLASRADFAEGSACNLRYVVID